MRGCTRKKQGKSSELPFVFVVCLGSWSTCLSWACEFCCSFLCTNEDFHVRSNYEVYVSWRVEACFDGSFPLVLWDSVYWCTFFMYFILRLLHKITCRYDLPKRDYSAIH